MTTALDNMRDRRTFETQVFIGFFDGDIGDELPVEVHYDITPPTSEGDGRPVPMEVELNSIILLPVDNTSKEEGIPITPLISDHVKEELIDRITEALENEDPEINDDAIPFFPF